MSDTSSVANPSVSCDTSGNFTITWQHYTSTFVPLIYFQRLDSNGNKIGINTKVNDDTANYEQENLDIAVRRDGSFIICWQDSRPPSLGPRHDIFFQMFDNNANKIGVNRKVNDDTALINQQSYPKISSDSIGNFAIAWSDNRLDFLSDEVFAQLYNSSGFKIESNFRVTQSSVDYGKGIGAVSRKENGDFVVCWTEFRNNGQPYFQRYLNPGVSYGNNYLVTNQSPFTEKYFKDINISNNRVISIWLDLRNGNFDIYCNIRSFTNPDSTVGIKQISTIIPEGFKLYQNYPNPFNNETTIELDINVNDNYKLEVYNLLGQKEEELINEFIEAGSYKVSYDASRLPSDVYYYSISSEKVKALKKFTIIK